MRALPSLGWLLPGTGWWGLSLGVDLGLVPVDGAQAPILGRCQPIVLRCCSTSQLGGAISGVRYARGAHLGAGRELLRIFQKLIKLVCAPGA